MVAAPPHAAASRDVYVVDDDPMLRRSMSFALGTAGFRVRPFVSGLDFVEELPSLVPGCVLLDIRMPDFDGFAVLQALRERRIDLPVIVLTGHGDVAMAVNAMKAGARDFIEKPCADDVLLATLEAAFDSLANTVPDALRRTEAAAKLRCLTVREGEVLRELVGGLPNKLIADRMGLSVRTVEMHRANMMARLELGSLAELLRLAFLAEVGPVSRETDV